MCGICGVVSAAPLTETERGRVRVMNASLRHRGPDGEGEFMEARVALAMRRLSIIDLTGGGQPLFNEDRSLALIANGEIYNDLELRAQLIARGHTFRSGSDCEAILHLYEDYGPDCVRHLRGMFAFALWDAGQRRLLLARDRMGEKPLYLVERAGQLWFASELRALLTAGVAELTLDPNAIDHYFHFQYVPEPATPLKGVRKLDAAQRLLVDTEPWRVHEECYWCMEEAPPLVGDPATLVRERLAEVSRLVVRSDVPVGVALSGGLDSSAVAALAVRSYAGTLHAFSVGYPGRPASDERADAQALAQHLELPFHEIELETSELVASFPMLVDAQDDPIADIAGLGYASLSRLARDCGVPVLLQGQGGDELFWGYPWVRQSARASARKARLLTEGWRRWASYLELQWPASLRRAHLAPWLRSLAGLKPSWEQLHRDRTAPAEQLVCFDQLADFGAGARLRTEFADPGASALNGRPASDWFRRSHPWPPVEIAMTRLICDTYLREDGITQGDRLSMASSIELRLPLVDYRLVETVIGLRKTTSDVEQPPKSWLRAAVDDVLPDWVMQRPKRGFAPPVREWHQALFAAHGDSLIDGFLVHHGVLHAEGARRLATGPIADDETTPLSFKALVLEQWCRAMARRAA